MKRQRGRNRGGNNGGGGSGGGGGKPQHNVNRAFESNGPDNVKIRGNAQHVFEKYQQLARDSSASGDRVLAENYLQHAEHYFRVLRAVQPQRPASEIIGRDAFASGFDIDFEDDNGMSGDSDGQSYDNAPEEVQAEQPQPRQDREWRDRGENRYRDDRAREDRPREDRPRDDRARDERAREERPREDKPRDDRPPREDRPRRDRFGREARFDRNRDRDPMAVVEPESTALTPIAVAPPPVAAAPVAPPPVVEVEPAPQAQLRSQDGSLSPAPAFLQAVRPEAETEAPAPRPRRTRRRATPRSFEGGEGEAPAAPETEEA
jgi:hypothetical protein